MRNTKGRQNAKTAMTYVATQTLSYRYKCEKCNTITPWYDSYIWESAENTKTINPRALKFDIIRTENELEETSQKALEKLEKLRISFEKFLSLDTTYTHQDIYFAEWYNNIFEKACNCPSCGAKQSWYPAYPFKINPWRSIRNYFLITITLSAIPLYMIYTLIEALDMILVIIIIFTIGVTMSVFGLIKIFKELDKIKHLEKKNRFSKKPEIQWNNPTVKLEGCPTTDEFEEI